MKTRSRYHTIDFIRGLALISMIIYHTCYDLAYIFSYPLPWFSTTGAYIWQQSIVITFIFISGISFSFSHNPIKRGLITLGGAFLLTLVTFFAMPDELVVFGVLHFLGLATLLTAMMRPLLKKINPVIGFIGFILCFVLTKQVPAGGILPNSFYQSTIGFIVGLPSASFVSSDYVPLIPWLFLYLTGYYLYQLILQKKRLPDWIIGINIPIINQAGHYSFLIYLIHQPVIYGILLLLNW